MLVFAVNFGRGSTYFVALRSGVAILGSVEEAFSVFMRLLFSGCVLAGVVDAVVLRFLDDGSVAVDSVVNVDSVDLDP